MSDVQFIMKDSDPRTATLTIGGQLVPVREVDIHVGILEPPLITATLNVMKIETIGEKVTWYGLEDVPTEVLEQVIEQRKEL